jgi:hypothetical protein
MAGRPENDSAEPPGVLADFLAEVGNRRSRRPSSLATLHSSMNVGPIAKMDLGDDGQSPWGGMLPPVPAVSTPFDAHMTSQMNPPTLVPLRIPLRIRRPLQVRPLRPIHGSIADRANRISFGLPIARSLGLPDVNRNAKWWRRRWWWWPEGKAGTATTPTLRRSAHQTRGCRRSIGTSRRELSSSWQGRRSARASAKGVVTDGVAADHGCLGVIPSWHDGLGQSG